MKSLYERLLDTEDSLIAGMEEDLYAAKVKEWADKVDLVKDNSDNDVFIGYDTYRISNNKVYVSVWRAVAGNIDARSVSELLPSDINIESIQELKIADTSCKHSDVTIRINTQKDIDLLSKIDIGTLDLYYNCDVGKLDFSKLNVDTFHLYFKSGTSISKLPQAQSIYLDNQFTSFFSQQPAASIDLCRIKGLKTNILKITGKFSINGVQICDKIGYMTQLIGGDDVTRELDKFISDNNIRDFLIEGVNGRGVHTIYMLKRLKNKYSLKKIR